VGGARVEEARPGPRRTPAPGCGQGRPGGPDQQLPPRRPPDAAHAPGPGWRRHLGVAHVQCLSHPSGDACEGVGGGVAGREADGGGVVPLRLSTAMYTTDEWRSSCVNRNMGGEGRGGEGRGGGGRRAAAPARPWNKWEGRGKRGHVWPEAASGRHRGRLPWCAHGHWMRLPHNSREGHGGGAGGSQRCPKGGHGRRWCQHAAIGGVLRSHRATHSRAVGCGAGRAVTSAREFAACVPVVSVVETASPRCTRPPSGAPRRGTRVPNGAAALATPTRHDP